MTSIKDGIGMDEIVVKKRKFDDALAKIKKASEENKNLPELAHFEEKGGLLSLFPKNVTGAQMNEFTSQLQANLIVLNEKVNNAYKQFNDVYAAFESLDKEYIAGIISAFNQAVEATKKAEDAQKEINKTVEQLQLTIEKMREFNKIVSLEFSKLDSTNWKENTLKYEHELKDLDTKAESITEILDSYKSQYNFLKNDLSSHMKEKARMTRNLKICWITTGVALVTTIVVVLLAVFHVI